MQSPKKNWKTPQLTVLGDFEQLTHEVPAKVYGLGDGAMFQGQDVAWDTDNNFIGS